MPTQPFLFLPIHNKLTRAYSPDFIGKEIGAFLDHVRSEYRIRLEADAAVREYCAARTGRRTAAIEKGAFNE
jgi:hypothetical protein